VKKGSLV